MTFSDDEKWPIFLVWSLHVDGSISLRAVATSREKAEVYRKEALPQEHGFLKGWVEPREANHLFGHDGALLSRAIMQSRGQLR